MIKKTRKVVNGVEITLLEKTVVQTSIPSPTMLYANVEDNLTKYIDDKFSSQALPLEQETLQNIQTVSTAIQTGSILSGYSLSSEDFLGVVGNSPEEGSILSYDDQDDIMVWRQSPNVRFTDIENTFNNYATQFDTEYIKTKTLHVAFDDSDNRGVQWLDHSLSLEGYYGINFGGSSGFTYSSNTHEHGTYGLSMRFTNSQNPGRGWTWMKKIGDEYEGVMSLDNKGWLVLNSGITLMNGINIDIENGEAGDDGKVLTYDYTLGQIVLSAATSGASATNHEDLTGLMGGAEDDHWHMTELEYSGLTTGGSATLLHIHDDRYYTEEEIDDIITGGTINISGITSAHTHPASQVTSGTFDPGDYDFDGTLTVYSAIVAQTHLCGGTALNLSCDDVSEHVYMTFSPTGGTRYGWFGYGSYESKNLSLKNDRTDGSVRIYNHADEGMIIDNSSNINFTQNIHVDYASADAYTYFGNSGNYILYDDATWDGFRVSDNVSVNGNVTADTLYSRGNIYLNSDGPDGNSWLYFYSGTQKHEYFGWNSATSAFSLSDDVVINGTISAASSLYLHYGSTTAQIFFGNAGENLIYNVPIYGGFRFSDPLQVAGSITGNNHFYLDGTAFIDQELHVNYDAVPDDGYIKFSNNTDRITYHSGDTKYFNFSTGVTVEGILSGVGAIEGDSWIRAKGSLITNSNAYVDYLGTLGGANLGSHLYFYGSSKNHYLQYSADTSTFTFSDDLFINGDLTVTGDTTFCGATIFESTVEVNSTATTETLVFDDTSDNDKFKITYNATTNSLDFIYVG